jgi:hypothetical protein
MDTPVSDHLGQLLLPHVEIFKGSQGKKTEWLFVFYLYVYKL